MINKKVITAITAALSFSIIASVTLAIYSLSRSADKHDPSLNKPLNRGNNYEHVDLTNQFDKSKIKDLIVTNNNDGTQSIFDKNKFKYHIETLIRSALSKIERFKNNVNNYKIVVSYQFTTNHTIAIDMV
jgi:hypothetical protein